MVDAFKQLLLDPGEWRVSPMGQDFARIDEHETARLEAPFKLPYEIEIETKPWVRMGTSCILAA